MRKYVLVVLLALPAAAVPVSWVNPTEYTDGAPLAAADIVRTNVYCTDTDVDPGATPVYATAQTFAGNGITGNLVLPSPRWCGKSTVALMPLQTPQIGPRDARESDISPPVRVADTRPKSDAVLKVQSAPPFSCPAGAVCPRP